MTNQIIKKEEIETENVSPAIKSTNEEKSKILRQRADLLKHQIEKEEVIGEQIKGLEFILANERYILDATYVHKVIPLKDLTSLSCTPDFILGIINVGGKIVSVINLKKFLNLPETDKSNQNRVIVLKHEDIELGILVDEIIGSTHLFLDKLQKDMSAFKGTQNDFLMGVTINRVIVLNIKKFLMSDLIIVNDEI